jgi:hypothetical protein
MDNFISLIEDGQTIATRVLAGSVPPGNDELWQYSRDRGYDTNLLRKVERDDGRIGEQAVDEILHLKIANVLLDCDEPGVIVLGTGDGQVSTWGTSFPLQAERALKKGWRVEVWSWIDQLSGAFKRLVQQYPDQIRIHLLDAYYYNISFVKGGIYSPPQITRIVYVKDRVAHQLNCSSSVYK